MKSYRDLLIILVLAVTSIIWASMIPILNSFPLNLIPYAMFTLFLTGYSLLAAVYPSFEEKSMQFRIIFSVNLSFIITALLILTISTDIPFILLLFYITLILTIIAIIRRTLPDTSEALEDVFESDEDEKLLKTPQVLPESEDVAVQVDDVSMEFNLSQEKVDNLKEYVIKLIKRQLLYQEFWALKHISFNVKKGDKVGIIGLNGAGKSTLLKLIAGVMKPTTGTIEVNGNIVPLLELGGGFDPNYTGRENIFLRGALLGYSKSFIKSKYDEIVEFSELEEFIDVPIKNYSSGMVSRLGFSLSTMVQPEILILDEVLSVGDMKFQEKSEERMKSFLNKETTVLLVSHSIAQVRKLCNRVIWIDNGEMVMEGPVDEVTEEFMKMIRAELKKDKEIKM